MAAPAEEWIVRAALERGFLSQARLEEVRRMQAASPHPGGLLGLLRERCLAPAQVQELQRAWQAAQSGEAHRPSAERLAGSSPTFASPALAPTPEAPASLIGLAGSSSFGASPAGLPLSPAAPPPEDAPTREPRAAFRPRPGSPVATGSEKSVGPFELVRELARGGMGVVWVARRPGLDRQVALKQLLPGDGPPNQAQVQRFLDEARLAARLQHPHIVRILEVGEQDGLPWFAMDLIEGESLSARIKARGPLPPREAASLFARLARALAYAHAQRLLHRDLKPANVLLTPEGEPVLTDFGLAKAVDDAPEQGLTRQGDVMGTPSYMPPEQAEGAHDRIDQRADVYSLGATLYEALTGRPPFAGRTVIAIIHAVMLEEPARPRGLVPGIPADLETIVLTCLEKDPLRRYPSASALAEDLERFLRDEPISARAPGPGERLVKWVRRNRALAAVVLVAGLLVAGSAGAAGLWSWRARQGERERVLEQARAEAAQAWTAAEAGQAASLDERVGLGLRALQTADRWYALAPLDRAAAEARYRAAQALGQVALDGKQWPLAAQAFRLAEGLRVDDAAASAAVAAVESARVAESTRRLEEVRELLGRAERMDLRGEEALEDAAHRIGRYPEPEVLAVVTGALEAASEALRSRLREVYLDACAPDQDEELLGRAELFGVGAALDAWLGPTRTAPGVPAPVLPRARLPEADQRALAAVEERLLARARRRMDRTVAVGELSLAMVLEGSLRDALGPGEVLRTRLAIRACARLGLPGGVPALGRYLALESAPGRAGEAARALLLLGGQEAEARVREALEGRFRQDEAFVQRLRLLLPDPAAGDSAADLRSYARELLSRGVPAATLAWVQARLEQEPGDLDLIEVRGQARRDQGDLAGARADAEAVLRADPQRLAARCLLVEVRMEEGQLDAALEEARALCQGQSQSAVGWRTLGRVLARREEHREAVEALQRALAMDPDAPDVLAESCLALTELERFAEAGERITRALELAPSSAEVQLALGWLRRGKRDLAGALEALERAAALQPGNPRVLLGLALVRLEAGDQEGALRHVERLLQRLPSSLDALALRAQIHYARRQLDLAREDLKRVRASGAASGAVLQRTGKVWNDMVELEEALVDLNAAVERSPRLALAWRTRGVVLSRLGRHTDALRDLDRALELEPKLQGLRGNRAIVLRDLGRKEEALAEFNALVEAEPEQPTARLNRGQALMMMGDLAGAEADAEVLIRVAPQSATGWLLRAHVRKTQRRLPEALEDATHALEVEPRSAYTWLLRGELLALSGKLEPALADFDRGLLFEPRNAPALGLRARVRFALGRRAEALADARRALELTPEGMPFHQDFTTLVRELERRQ